MATTTVRAAGVVTRRRRRRPEWLTRRGLPSERDRMLMIQIRRTRTSERVLSVVVVVELVDFFFVIFIVRVFKPCRRR